MNKKELVIACIQDCVTDLLYLHRKEDDELQIGDIELMIKSGDLTIDEILEVFRKEIELWVIEWI